MSRLTAGQPSARVLARRLTLPVFMGACLTTVALRSWALASPGFPAGVDGGNWLSFGRTLLGHGVSPPSRAYPPVVPLLLTSATELIGPTAAVAWVAGLTAAAPAAGAFLVLRWAGLGGWATVLAALLLPASALGEIATWGGYPQLLAAPMVLIALWTLDRWFRTGERTALIGTVSAGLLVLATSHFATLIGASAAMAIFLLHLGFASDNRRGLPRRAAGALGLLAVVALPLAPTYARLVPAVLGSRAAEPSLATIEPAQIPARFVSIHGASWPVWAVGLLALLLAPVLRSKPAHCPLRVLAAGLGAGLAGGLLLTAEPRLLYEVPMLATLGLGLWVHKVHSWRGRRRGVAAALASGVGGALVLVAAAGVIDFPKDRDHYSVLDVHLLGALGWIQEETPPGSLIMVSSLHDAPLGWWVEGLSDRPTFSAAPLRWLIFPEERMRAQTANRLFFVAGLPSTEGLAEARALGVDFVLIAKDSLAHDAGELHAYLGTGRPAFENPEAVILEVAHQLPDQARGR